MIRAEQLQKEILELGISVQEFARRSGRKVATIKRWLKKGVPVKEESSIRAVLDACKKPIFFGEQLDMIDE